MRNDKDYDALVNEALAYVRDLAEREVGGVDSNKLLTVTGEADNARDLRTLRAESEVNLAAAIKKKHELQDKIEELEEKLQNFRYRESMHTGMCAGFEKSLMAVAQGFATGK